MLNFFLKLKTIPRKFFGGLFHGLGIGLGIALISFGVWLVLAVAPGTFNPTGPPGPATDVSWYPPLYVGANNVGIGTDIPAEKLSVQGNIYASGNITCGGTCGGLWTKSGTNIYYNTGNVGIANPTPNFALDVTGQIHATGDICTAVASKCLSTVSIPSGMIAMFDTNCPAGWTRFSALDNRVPLGDSNYGGSGGSATHSHSFNQRCGVTGGGGSWCYVTNASVSANNLPPYLAVIWCKKDQFFILKESQDHLLLINQFSQPIKI